MLQVATRTSGVVLEAIDGFHALLGVIRARDRDALFVEDGLVPIQSLGEGNENNHLSIRGNDIADSLFHGLMLAHPLFSSNLPYKSKTVQ
jgi:hypothetical protein